MFSTSIRTVLLVALSLMAITTPIAAQELVKDINTSKIGAHPQRLKAGTSAFVFEANSREYGTELFKSDGTASGTNVLLDYTPGLPGSNLLFHTVIDNFVYMAVSPGDGVIQIQKIDLSDNNTEELASISGGSIAYSTSEEGFYKVGNVIYFFVKIIAPSSSYGKQMEPRPIRHWSLHFSLTLIQAALKRQTNYYFLLVMTAFTAGNYGDQMAPTEALFW